MQAITVEDDRGFTYSEQHRHECEVRYVAGLAGKGDGSVGEFLRGIEKRRGSQAAQKLYADVKKLFDEQSKQRKP